jgi:diguanylate cyclase (GGDEF)-like protein
VVSGIGSSVKLCDMNPMENRISDFSPVIFEALGFGVIIVDAETHRIVYANSKIYDMGGYPAGTLIGQACHGMLCPAEAGQCPITDHGQSVDNSERLMVRADGTGLPIINTAVSMILEGRNYLIESIVDNSERTRIQSELTKANESLQKEIVKREQMQNKIEHLAYHDHLTGLANRLLFTDQLDHAVFLSGRMAKKLAIMFLDLDGFKMINDTMGHAIGDQLLKEVSRRLVNMVRKSDVVARIGGDEFIIMIENEVRVEAIRLVAGKILNCFKDPFTLNGHDCFMTASIGVAIYPADGENAETLIKNADIAMYKAKENGRNKCFFCTPAMKAMGIETIKLRSQSYYVIDRQDRELYYSPQGCGQEEQSEAFNPC